MLLGSAHTRNSRFWAFTPTAAEISNKKPPKNLRHGEYIKHPPFVRVMRKILRGCRESQSRGLIASIQPPRHDRASPAAHTRQDGDILFPIRSPVRWRLADNSRTGFE